MLSVALAALMAQAPDDVIGFVSENLAKGNGNFLTYFRFSDQKLTVQEGDVLVYDVLLDPKNPSPKGGVDVEFDQGVGFRDRGAIDQNGLRAHGDALLNQAVGKWYTRRIPMDAAKGATSETWNLVFEGDEFGRYLQFVDNVRVERKDGKTVWIYQDGLPTVRSLYSATGYTQKPWVAVVEKSRISDLEAAKAQVVQTAERVRSLEQARQDIALVREFVKEKPDPHLQAHLLEATAALDNVERNAKATPQEVEAALHTVQHALQHTHPAMEGYTGHLVGHAHIDLMWLWEWQEGIVASRDTFVQVDKFMDEFPGFTFSQSSSAIYKTIEEYYPELFKAIQKRVKQGRWELVGGRVDEGDTNMISPESHARHFLYGQRYFREKFGKTATVGWEPDTFGHTIQMPQILKLGGCDSYYFCRGGKGKPLFWWQGLDGTRMLSFEEPATNSWYNSDLSYKNFQEMLDFRKNNGSKDMLWVYGVGNHGGGPTREDIQEALSWMKDPSKPKVRFSTATEFFNKLRTYDLTKIPVVADELNPVFEGCYTSHAEVKRLNRHAEYSTSSTEALATVASMFGFAYPRAAFQRNWEDITFHHHHDTLPGSFIHPASEKTVTQLQRVLAENADIAQRAMETLTLRVTPKEGGVSQLVFNPTGWARSGWVEAYAWASGWSQNGVDPTRLVAVDPDGKEYPVEVVDRVLRKVRLWAADVQAFGYKVFQLKNVERGKAVAEIKSPDAQNVLENDLLRVRFNNEIGAIDQILDKRTGEVKNYVATTGSMGRLEIHHEAPQGMSAWTLGPTTSVSVLKPADMQRGAHKLIFKSVQESLNNPGKPTTITQTFTLLPGSDQVDVDVECDWQHIGNGRTGGPTLRVAFDTSLQNPTAAYEVPFGAIDRPNDGKEVVGLNWQDLSNAAEGVAVLNDSKSGMSADGSTMRLTMIRSSYDPDTNPNPGYHHWRYAIVPHQGGWRQAGVVRKGYEFQQPMLAATVPFDARGTAPLTWGLVKMSDPNVVPITLKRSEDGDDVVLRMYESTGARSNGTIEFAKAIGGASWVNFVEDRLAPAPANRTAIPFGARGYEIKSVKVNLR
jgi:alpha-mannosidase